MDIKPEDYYVNSVRNARSMFARMDSAITLRERLKLQVLYWSQFTYCILLTIIAYMAIPFLSRNIRYDSSKAVRHVNSFVDQYPFHLYPVVAKSLESFFLIEVIQVQKCNSVIEAAIGEGSLSKRIFDGNKTDIIAFDINPYSLEKVSFSNVRKKVISDCSRLPLTDHSTWTIVSNNLVHHITDKEGILRNWSAKAKRVIFNENTPMWSTGHPSIFLRRLFGFSKEAIIRQNELEMLSAQSLRDSTSLDVLVESTMKSYSRFSFYNELVHFLAMITSYLYTLFGYPTVGPPTPARFRSICNDSVIMRVVMCLATNIAAKALIRLDSHLSNPRDVFIYYDCVGWTPDSVCDKAPELVCLKCGAILSDNACENCGKIYPIRNGMFFLLDDSIQDLGQAYDESIAALVPKEHL